MNNTVKVPVKVIENWYKERVETMMKNFRANQPRIPEGEIDKDFLNGAWNGARLFLETEYNMWVDADNPVQICEKCGDQKFITKI